MVICSNVGNVQEILAIIVYVAYMLLVTLARLYTFHMLAVRLNSHFTYLTDDGRDREIICSLYCTMLLSLTDNHFNVLLRKAMIKEFVFIISGYHPHI